MVGRRVISGRQALGIEKDMREGLYGHLLRLSFGFYDRHQTGPADVARDRRPAVGALLPRLRADLLLPARPHDRLGDGRALRDRVAARADRARDHAGDRRRRLPLQPRLAPRPARRPAEARRRRDGRRGVDRRRPRRQVVRAGGAAPGDVRARVRQRSSTRPCARSGSARSTCRCSRSCRCSRRRPCCSPPAGWSSTARSRLGQFFVFNLLLAMLIVPLRSLGMWVGQAQRATASGERIFEVMDEPEGVDDRPGATELPDGPGRDPLRAASASRYAAGPARAARDRPRARAREDGRADRPHGLGQDDARRARAALLRRDRGPRARRRRRRPRGHAPLAPARDRRHLAGSVPLLGDRPREHRLRRPRRARTSGSSRPRAPRRRTSSSRSCRTATTP